MKTLHIFIVGLVLSLSLNARENPFEVTNAYEEENARIIEQNEASLVEKMEEEQYIKEIQNKMNKVEEAKKKIVPIIKEKTYSKKEVDSLINKTKRQTEYKAKQLVKKEIEKTKAKQPTQIVYVKPRTDIVSEDEIKTKQLLNFVKVEYDDDKLIIHTKYPILKKFTLNKENKIIVDYKAKLRFYTKRDTLDSKSFKRIAVGNHRNKRYFRVVVELDTKPSNYKVVYEDKLITISKI